jgi:hypothetical protein
MMLSKRASPLQITDLPCDHLYSQSPEQTDIQKTETATNRFKVDQSDCSFSTDIILAFKIDQSRNFFLRFLIHIW